MTYPWKMSRKRKEGERAAYEDRFMVEIARGSSYIMSGLTGEARDAAITAVLSDLRSQHPAANVSVFLELLLHNLNRRAGKEAAAATHAVAQFARQFRLAA